MIRLDSRSPSSKFAQPSAFVQYREWPLVFFPPPMHLA